MSIKKTLFVTRPLSPPWDEASKNFAFDLACNLTKQNITILVNKQIKNIPAHITQKKIYTHNNFSFTQKVHLIRYLKKYTKDFDIIHLFFTPTKANTRLMRSLLAQKRGEIIQTVATLRDDLYAPSDFKNLLYGDTIVTYSHFAKEKLENIGIENVTHIYPGLDLSKFRPTDKDKNIMQKWNITNKDFVVTYPGEFVRLGATDLIIDTFLELWKNPNNHHIKYLCACRIKNNADAKKKQEVIKKITKAGHINKIIFTDTFEDMNVIYNLSDAVIFPVTNMYGKFDVPLAMIEPYACKKPVIASDLELFKEFSNENINVVIPKNDKIALIKAILDLEKNLDKRKKLGENAFKFVHDTFNIKQTAKQYANIYNLIK